MSEVIYMYRRKGQDSWATCDESRYLDLGGSHFFEVRIIHTSNEYAALPATHPAPESVGGEKMRERFSQIENEIMAGKHTASSVFTQMRTAALYMAATAPAGSRVVQVELLQDLCDLASDAVEHHRQAFAGYKLERQANMDETIKAGRALLEVKP